VITRLGHFYAVARLTAYLPLCVETGQPRLLAYLLLSLALPQDAGHPIDQLRGAIRLQRATCSPLALMMPPNRLCRTDDAR
jgi:hypothetical protein